MKATCTIITVILSTIAIVTANNEVCKGVPDGNARPNVNDCSKFYVCLGEIGISKDCGGDGLHFNPILLFCQKPEEAGCVAIPTDPPTNPTDPPTKPTDPPTIPTDPPTKPTDPPTIPTDPPTIPTDPPTIPTDPPTKPTDPPTKPTDPPTKPTDPPTIPTKPTGHPTNRPIPVPPGICKNQELGHKINYPGDCTKFIVCIGGGVGFQCPGGLYFNAKSQVCDWKEQSGCVQN